MEKTDRTPKGELDRMRAEIDAARARLATVAPASTAQPVTVGDVAAPVGGRCANCGRLLEVADFKLGKCMACDTPLIVRDDDFRAAVARNAERARLVAAQANQRMEITPGPSMGSA